MTAQRRRRSKPPGGGRSAKRSMWTGYISFGLVNVPVKLYNGVSTEELSFRFLHRKDLSPISYEKVCEREGREVPWEDIVRGYEYEKGKFVVLTDEDFKRADVEATQTIDILVYQSHAAPRAPLESPCAAFTSGVST